MRKVRLIILSFIMVLSLAACGRSNNHSMTIKEKEFSDETKKVLSIFKDELVFFDYKVDQSIKSMSIDIWTCENGEWINEGETFGNIETSDQQIAIRINDLSYDIFFISKNGHTKSSYPSVIDFSNSKMVSNSRLHSPTKIEKNKEIPLWVRLGADKNSMSTDIMDDFRQADCNTGVAVTITFFDGNIDNREQSRYLN